jgi:hypothetical protein
VSDLTALVGREVWVFANGERLGLYILEHAERVKDRLWWHQLRYPYFVLRPGRNAQEGTCLILSSRDVVSVGTAAQDERPQLNVRV